MTPPSYRKKDTKYRLKRTVLGLAAYVGTAYLSAPVNWSTTGNLYFSVAGGPPNTCGDLVSIRNGSDLYSPGWLCTDASGNAMMGPWTWAGTPGNQTDTNLRIYWPNGDSTPPINHVWDKTCNTITRTSASGTPPSAFAGHADDSAWGAGFNTNWTEVGGYFMDQTSNTFWKPGLTSYSASFNSFYFVFPTVIGWPLPGETSLSIGWSFPDVPPATAHVSGHHYEWAVGVTDGDGNCPNILTLDFVEP
jgi:hypothetical protein